MDITIFFWLAIYVIVGFATEFSFPLLFATIFFMVCTYNRCPYCFKFQRNNDRVCKGCGHDFGDDLPYV